MTATHDRPYAGLLEALTLPPRLAQPAQDLRDSAHWPPTLWDRDLERAFRRIRAERRWAQRDLDTLRNKLDSDQRLLDRFTVLGAPTPSTRKLQKLADLEDRYTRTLTLERELGQYRPVRPFLRWKLRSGPVPAARTSLLHG